MKNNKKWIIFLCLLVVECYDHSLRAARQTKVKDPFHSATKKKKRPVKKSPAKITVKGIAFVDKKNASALLECGKKTKMVVKGISFKKFVVRDIRKDCVILEKDQKKITIFFEC